MNGSLSEFNATDLDMWIPSTSSGMDSCKMFANGTNSSLTACTSGWVYDTTYYKSSRAIEWNFVCSQRWMGAVAQSMYMFGVFFGAVTLGGLADKVSRRFLTVIIKSNKSFEFHLVFNRVLESLRPIFF